MELDKLVGLGLKRRGVLLWTSVALSHMTARGNVGLTSQAL